MSAVADEKKIVAGGSFLIEERAPAEIFTPEDFTEEHRMIGETTREFMDKEVRPREPELEQHKWDISRELLRHAGELGLIGATVPEEYGGGGVRQGSGRCLAEKLRWH